MVEDSPYATVDAPAGAVRVFSDGACQPNPGRGGFGWVVEGDPSRRGSGWAAWTTNQRMEIAAALDAVLSVPGPLVVVSDSRYVVQCMRDGWWVKWREQDWHRDRRRLHPVANRDLWEPLAAAVSDRSRDVVFQWVRGHNGDRWNEYADRLAVQAQADRCGREYVPPVPVWPVSAQPAAVELSLW
jgi:ribonuclease HI